MRQSSVLSRREFLKIAGRALGAAPFGLWHGGCALAGARLDADESGMPLGYVAGDVTPHEATIWLRADPESVVSLHYGRDTGLRKYASTETARVDLSADYTVKFRLAGLEPGSVYYYRGVVAGKKAGPFASFKTAPRPDDPSPVNFCFSGDSRESYKPFSIMDSIRARRPDFFLHLGDTIYADRDGRASRLSEFWTKYRANRNDPPSRRLFSETSVYAVWDDHEVADNYDAAHPLAPTGRRAFFDYWPIQRHPREADRVYRSFRWGQGMELFILDTRQYRDRALGTILGKEQKEWLLESLSASAALFKFIATSVPFSAQGSDKWGGFPAERAEVIEWIRTKKISGVVFISADVHYAAVSRVPGGLGVKEIIAGPLAARLNRTTRGTARRFEFFFNEAFNYAGVTVDPSGASPTAHFEIFDLDNKSLYRTSVEAG